MIAYHDTEWGVPLHDERKLFEFMILDAFQAGLSWRIVLHKRQGFAKAFANFDPQKVARFGAREVKRLGKDEKIIRNRLKIQATITNAKAFLAVQKEWGSFDKYLWSFVKGKPIINRFRNQNDLPARTPLSDAISDDLKRRGFKFVGTTICYAFMQAAGLVNDHLVACFSHPRVSTRK